MSVHIEVMIFDVGGVLDVPADREAEEADRHLLAAELGMGLEEMWRRFYHSDNWKLARIGKISDQELWNRNLTPFGISDPADQLVFIERLFAFKETNPAMRALLDELDSKTRLAIISNATDLLEHSLEKRYRISHLFDQIINSARVGYAKPEPEIYQIALERLAVRPDQAVFTDDQQHNVDAAAQLGMHAVLFTGVPDLREFLMELGVLH